jgi:hypothetical protein
MNKMPLIHEGAEMHFQRKACTCEIRRLEAALTPRMGFKRASLQLYDTSYSFDSFCALARLNHVFASIEASHA